MATAVDLSFLQLLKASHLLGRRELAQVERAALSSKLADKPRLLAQALVQRRFLTEWQALQLLEGRQAFFLGKYKLLDRIGSGGMGSVFKAMHCQTGELVALKVVQQDRLQNPANLVRFEREIQAVAMLKHPNVVTALEADRVGDFHFLVMEYVDGRDLNRWIKEYRNLPIAWSCECIRQAALGLEHARQMGLVHRDIKPANLIVLQEPKTGFPQIKIVDLGLARFVRESGEDAELTDTGQILGTPDYIAPEQAKNTHTADIRADIFSLGCTLYRLLAGRLPFEGSSAVEKLLARYTQDPLPLRHSRAEVPPPLEAVVMRMLARDPKHRYQTPAEVAIALFPFSLQQEISGETVSSLSPPLPPPKSRLQTSEPASDLGSNTQQFLNMLAERAEQAGGATNGRPQAVVETSPWSTLPTLQSISPRVRPAAPLLPWFIGSGLIVLFAAVLASWFYFARPGSLSIDLSPGELAQANVYVDGARLFPMASGEGVRYAVPRGAHRLRIEVPGFDPYETDLVVGSGQSVRVSPHLRESEAQARLTQTRERETQARLAREAAERARVIAAESQARLDELARFKTAFAPLLSARPTPEVRQQLREALLSLETFAVHWEGTEEARRARELASELANRLRLPPAVPEAAPLALAPLSAPAAEIVAVAGNPYGAHFGSVTALEYSIDGSQLASAGADQAVRVWNARGALSHQWLAGPNPYKLAFSSDQRLLAAIGYRGGSETWLKVWDLESSQLLQDIAAEPFAALSIAFVGARDPALVVGTAGGELITFHPRDGRITARAAVHTGPIRVLAATRHGDRLASAADDGVRVWDVDLQTVLAPRGRLPLVVPAGIGATPVWYRWSLAFDTPGRRLATLTFDRTVRIWNSETLAAETEIPDPWSAVQSIAFSHDGARLAFVGRGVEAVRLWSFAKSEFNPGSLSSEPLCRALAFDPRGTVIALAEGSQVAFRDAHSTHPAPVWGPQSPLVGLAFRADGQALWLANADESLYGLPAPRFDAVQSIVALDGSRLTAFRPGVDGRHAIVQLEDGRVARLDYATSQLTPLALPGDIDLESTAIARDGRSFSRLRIQGAKQEAFLETIEFDATAKTSQTKQRRWPKNEPLPIAVTYLPPGALLLVVPHASGAELRWSAPHRPLPEMRMIVPETLSGILAVSPDGRRLAALSSDGRVVIVDLHSRKHLASWPLTSEVLAVAFSPREQGPLAILTRQGTLLVTTIEHPEQAIAYPLFGPFPSTAKPHPSRLAFSADGSQIAVASPGRIGLILASP